MTGEIRELTTDAEWEEGVRILHQLWDWKERAEIHSWREQEGYQLLGYHVDGDIVGVAGVFVQVVLHHQKSAWVHDLVVDEPYRGQGHGGDFLDALEEWAEERECGVLALVNNLDNERATAFYDDHMDRFGYVYERELE
jgi:GNAT superfamily N-acetyltransferase